MAETTTKKGGLILLATPIGNLGDISRRAIETLERCDFIAAEDTRVTLRLLNHLSIKKPMISYFEHNKREREEQICGRILDGELCVLVSDAGMPAISDPGEELVARCYELGISVSVVPGPSAVVSALAISGLPTGRFTFEGFLSTNKKLRNSHLLSLKNETRTMIFYEAPHKLARTLKDMLEVFDDRKISIVREITKLYEEVIRTTIEKAAERFSQEALRGEIVLVVEGKAAEIRSQDEGESSAHTVESAVALAKKYMAEGASASQAAKAAAKETAIRKGDIYSLLNE